MANAASLHELVREKIGGSRFVVVSNREPYLHIYREGRIECMRPASGMVTALEPVVRAVGGLWVAHGAGNADHEVADERGRVSVPPGDPHFLLRRVWLSKDEEERYYHGFSNATIWPLCHGVYVRPAFHHTDWETYVKVNERFAEAILEEIDDEPAFVWIQDFHLALLPKMLKDRRPDVLVAQFWHVPWPNPETFRTCPWKHEILWGLLANDLLGFHIRYHCDNFLNTADLELEVRIDRERSSVFSSGHEARVRPFPIGVDFERLGEIAEGEGVARRMRVLREEFNLQPEILILGVDRFDYTKGIPERIRAIDRLLEKYPEYRGRILFFQTGPTSRLHVKQYRQLNDDVNALVEEVNWKHSSGRWQPVLLVRRHLNEVEMSALYRAADVCVVSSLHDGMNLIAKEFVASRTDENGCLVLSCFTGAARELEQAVMVNPYDTEQFADSLRSAIEMPREERRERMVRMRRIVQERNVYAWAEQFVTELSRLT